MIPTPEQIEQYFKEHDLALPNAEIELGALAVDVIDIVDAGDWDSRDAFDGSSDSGVVVYPRRRRWLIQHGESLSDRLTRSFQALGLVASLAKWQRK